MLWKPGDLAIIISASQQPACLNTQCTVLGASPQSGYEGFLDVDVPALPMASNGMPWCIEPQYLRPVPPPPDHTVATWDESLWSPYVTVENT